MFSEIKNILLPLSKSDDLDIVMSVALDFAQRFQAHLSTVIVGTDASEVAALAGEGIAASMVTDIIDTATSEAQQCAQQIRNGFANFIKSHNIKYIETSEVGSGSDDTITASLEVLDGNEDNSLTWHSRLADMTLVPNLINSTNPRSSEILHSILFDSGRPLVIVPPEPPKSVGSRISIAWNGTAEAALALRSILPWAQKAESVQVLTGEDYQRNGPAGEQVIRYLKMHGISASLKEFSSPNNDVGAGILNAAEDFGSDMLGMGAYSHSRLRQMFLGGPTRYVLENMKMTVLMSR